MSSAPCNYWQEDKTDNQWITIGAGFNHDGSLRAQKIENDANRAAFEALSDTLFAKPLGLKQHLYTKAFNRHRFSLVSCPRTDTSIENWKTENRWAKSATRVEYFSCLYSWLRWTFKSGSILYTGLILQISTVLSCFMQLYSWHPE